MLKLAQVIVSEGGNGIISRAIQRTTDSIWSHACLITGPDEIVEAWFPRVRKYSIDKRLNQLDKERRKYVVLDYPDHTQATREAVAKKARSYIGRFYDVPDVLHYLIKGRFREDKGGELFCSRLITASYLAGANIDLYPPELTNVLARKGNPRIDNIEKGLVTPADLFDSMLEERWRRV